MTRGAFQEGFGGRSDAVVVKLDPTGASLIWSTYLGGGAGRDGGGDDEGRTLTLDAAGAVYIAGTTDFGQLPRQRRRAPGRSQGRHGRLRRQAERGRRTRLRHLPRRERRRCRRRSGRRRRRRRLCRRRDGIGRLPGDAGGGPDGVRRRGRRLRRQDRAGRQRPRLEHARRRRRGRSRRRCGDRRSRRGVRRRRHGVERLPDHGRRRPDEV